MRLSHRARLTLAAAGTAGLLFAALFAMFGYAFAREEAQTVQNTLTPAVAQMTEDIKAGQKPDLDEVVLSNTDISLAVFDKYGNIVARDGLLDLPFQTRAGIQDGLALHSGTARGLTVVAGTAWGPHDAVIRRFFLICALLWPPLVAVVALSTWLAARATFMPLARLTQEAEQLSTESLTSRLHVEDSGEYGAFVSRLNRFLERLEASVKREERFLSDAAHELRTPLTVLRGEIESSLRKSRTEPEYRATLAILLDETARLSTLVELLLRSAQPETLEAASIDARAAVQKAHARWVDRFTERGVRLEPEASAGQASVSEAEFDVIVDNLLSNSLRASPSGSACRIETHPKDGVILLSVRDEGPGIAPDDSERIFDRFARSDSGRSRMDGGFGIGLALCKRIVEARGGTIRVEPNEPRGSLFCVELRRAH